jgi:membrane protein
VAVAAEDTPESLLRRAWRLLPDGYRFFIEATHRMDAAEVRLYTAAIAYRTVFSFIAFLSTIAVIALMLGITPGDLREEAGGSSGGSSSSSGLEEIALERAARTLELGQSTAWIAGIIGFGFGLYTLSAGFAALCEVLDRIHGTHVYRRMSQRYLRGLGISIVFLVFAIIVAIALLITTGIGAAVFGWLGLDRVSSVWQFVFRVIIPTIAVPLTFGFLLRYGSHARPPWREVLPGAVVGAAAWLLLLSGFAAYVAWFDGFQYYGALASVFALLMFGYLQSWILILVALFRSEIAFVIALIPFVRQSGADGAGVEFELPRGLHVRGD